MRQKSKKVRQQYQNGDNSEANATNRVFIAQKLTKKRDLRGKKGKILLKMDDTGSHIIVSPD